MKKHIFTGLLVLLPLFGMASAEAASGIKLAGVEVAMLDLKHFDMPAKQAKQTVKKSATKPPVFNYPENCLTWNKKMILNKSRFFDKTINKYARLYKVDSNLVRSVITAESCFKTKALSPANAQGLMQLIPDTAKRFGVTNSYDHKQNIRGGTKYLQFLLARFKGDLKKVIAAYNAGEGSVDKYKGIPPYKETQRYVKNVLKVYALLKPKPKVKVKAKPKRVKAVYQPPKKGLKPGRHGWQYNRRLAPHLYKH